MDKSSVQCNICHKIFANKDNLKVHIKSSHLIKKFACKECDKVYSRKQTLRGHVKAVHEGQRYVYTHDDCDETLFKT